MTVVLRERLAQSFVTKRPLIAERARVLFGMLLRRANSIHLLPERLPLLSILTCVLGHLTTLHFIFIRDIFFVF